MATAAILPRPDLYVFKVMTPAPLYTPRRLTPAHTAATPATDAIGMESDGPTGHQPGMQYDLPPPPHLPATEGGKSTVDLPPYCHLIVSADT